LELCGNGAGIACVYAGAKEVLIFSGFEALIGQNSNTTTAKKRRLGPEDLMTPDKVAIPNVQTLKFRRDELFREFEDHPGKLALAREIKDIDDQIAELNVGKKKARAEFPK
jgi:hypothetical protein